MSVDVQEDVAQGQTAARLPKLENGTVCVRFRGTSEVDALALEGRMKRMGMRDGVHYMVQNLIADSKMHSIYTVPRDNALIRKEEVIYVDRDGRDSKDMDVIPSIVLQGSQLSQYKAQMTSIVTH